MEVKIIEGLCTNCEKITEQEIIAKEETLNVRNEPVQVTVNYLRCKKCGDEVYDTTKQDPFALAYRKYREFHGLLQPEQIKECRECHGLTQLELAKLLRLGVATISRYENGTLQDASHDTLLRLAMDPINLSELIEKSIIAFSEERKKELLLTLTEVGNGLYPLEKIFERLYRNDTPKDTNGYRKLNREKLYEAILFLCDNGVWKTKVNKLLFYLDFKNFKEFTTSITGAEYAHIQYGPVPDHYEFHYNFLKLRKDIESEEKYFTSGEGGEIIRSLRKPNLNVFNHNELLTLTLVNKYFESYTARAISDLSHEEVAYKETKPGETISYKYAIALSI